MNHQLVLPISVGPRQEDLVQAIPGLRLINGFLTEEEQKDCLLNIDSPNAPWENDQITRRTQQFGYHYDYIKRVVTLADQPGILPSWLAAIARRLYDETEAFLEIPNQVIINEYLQGQGIQLHADSAKFGPAVATISLAEKWTMDFKSTETKEKVSIPLPIGSCLLFTGESRHKWQHGIDELKTEPTYLHNHRIPRGWRVSITFRTVNQQ